MSRIAYIDCSSGVSGDMLIGAMLDAGLELETLKKGLAGLGLPDIKISSEKVSRGGLRATHFIVDTAEESPARHWSEIRDILEKSSLDKDVKTRALAAFARLAKCEAGLHGVDVEKVHFHELSGIDAIVDIVGAFIGIKALGIERVVVSPINVGSGTVECRHGILPVPAPATAELLIGAPCYSKFDGELTTPTGALLVTELAGEFGPMPLINTAAVGWGAGTRDAVGRPNALRMFVGFEYPADISFESLLQLQTNIDDMNPQVFPYIIEKLLAAGAPDAWIETAIMKKGRPAVVFNILCRPEQLNTVFSILISETTTLGARIIRTERACIGRRMESVDTEFGKIAIKIGVMNGAIMNVMPEYEDCAAAARKAGAPLLVVMEAARRAAAEKWKAGERIDD